MLIQVLGPLRLGDGEVSVNIGPPRVRRGLARLAVDAGRFVSVDALAEAIWGAKWPTRPHKAVQDVIADLRRAFGDDAGSIETRADGRAYRLVPQPSDLDALLAARDVRHGTAALRSGDFALAAAAFDAAVARFVGEPYEEYADDAFSVVERQRLAGLHAEAVEGALLAGMLAGRLIDLTAMPQMIDAAPSRWRPWAVWMLELHRLGRQADALAVFQAALDRFGERGVDAPPELRAIENLILGGEPIPAGPLHPLAPPSIPTVPPMLRETRGVQLIGRDVPLGQLRDAWAQCASGHGAVATITGEEGIGKSSLIGAFAESVAATGGLVLAGRAMPTAVTSYRAVAEALEGPLRDRAERLADDPVLAPLGRLFPSMATPATTASGDPGNERQAMFAATTALVEELAGSRPVLLVLDDLHWADAATSTLVAHLVDSLTPRTRLLVVLAYRDGEVGVGHPLQAVLATAARRAPLRINLDGLSRHGLAELISIRLGAESATDEMAAALETMTEGSPLFADEVLRHLTQAFGAGSGASGRPVAVGDLARLGIPDGVRAIVLRRLGSLTETTRRVVVAASVIGRSFSLGLLEQLGVGTRGELLDALDAADVAGLLVDQPGTAESAFRHGLVHDVVYESISGARRADLHLRIADALRARPGSQSGRSIAHHLLEAGALADAGVTTAVVCGAAMGAARQLDFESTGGLLDRLEAALQRAENPDGRLLAQLLLTRASAQRLTGDVLATKAAALRACIRRGRRGRSTSSSMQPSSTRRSVVRTGPTTRRRSICCTTASPSSRMSVTVPASSPGSPTTTRCGPRGATPPPPPPKRRWTSPTRSVTERSGPSRCGPPPPPAMAGRTRRRAAPSVSRPPRSPSNWPTTGRWPTPSGCSPSAHSNSAISPASTGRCWRWPRLNSARAHGSTPPTSPGGAACGR